MMTPNASGPSFTMTILVIFIATVVLLPLNLAAQTIDPAKRQQIDELIRLTNMNAIMGPVIDQCIVIAKGHNPDVPDAFWQQERRILLSDTPSYTNAQAATLAKYFSTEDLQAIVAFYKTPAGQHYIQALPAITQEGMQTMQTWAKGLSAGTVARLRAAGYTPGK
jgi:hypothetical protein